MLMIAPDEILVLLLILPLVNPVRSGSFGALVDRPMPHLGNPSRRRACASG